MSIEAMKQAYEVPLVEQLESVPTDARLVIDDADGMGTHYIPVGRMCHDAAKALRTAIGQAGKPSTRPATREEKIVNPGVYEVPVQEPVAWVYEFWADRGYKGLDFEPQKYADNTPLYTTPPKREWVGLTDEEIEEIWGEDLGVMYSGNIKATKAIEAKLKEKNT